MFTFAFVVKIVYLGFKKCGETVRHAFLLDRKPVSSDGIDHRILMAWMTI